jgi:hypothetical protein
MGEGQMSWTPQAIDGPKVICTDGDTVAIADLFEHTLQPLNVNKYSPLSFGQWEAVTAKQIADIEAELPTFKVLGASGLVAALVQLYSDDQPRDDHGRWTSDGGAGTSRPPVAGENSGTQKIATRLLGDAVANEPKITGDLKTDVATTDHGASIAGLDSRLKTEDSLTHKIASDAIEKNVNQEIAGAEISDVLRYTQTTPPEAYTSSVQSTVHELENRGYILDKVKNTWGGADYRGINTQWHSPDGQHFELQFHTPQSFATKDDESPGSLHSLFSEARLPSTSDARRAELDMQMAAITSHVVVPVGAASLTYDTLASHTAQPETISQHIERMHELP